MSDAEFHFDFNTARDNIKIVEVIFKVFELQLLQLIQFYYLAVWEGHYELFNFRQHVLK